MGVALIKSEWTSGNLRFRSKDTNPTTTPIMQFGQTDYPLQSKFHNRPAIAGSTVEVRARPSSATAEHFAVDSTVDWRPTGETVTGGGIRAIQGVSRLDAGITITGGSLIGSYGQVALNATAVANGAGVMMAAQYGLIEDGGTYTAVSHVCAAWFDSHLAKTVTAGNKELIYASNNGATTLDQVLYAYGGDKITNLLNLNTVSGMVDDADAAGDYTFTATKKINIVIDGETYVLIADKPAA